MDVLPPTLPYTRIRAFETKWPRKTSPHLRLGAQDLRLGAEQNQLPCGSTGTSSGNCREAETHMVRTASPKPSFRAPWRVDDGVVGRGTAGRTTSKSGHPCPCRDCLGWPPAENAGRRSLLNRSSCPRDDPNGSRTEELNQTELTLQFFFIYSLAHS